MKNQKSIQQGDVLGSLITVLPKGQVKVISKNRCVIAHGESGHSHVIDSPGAKMFSINNTIFLDLQESATLTHEEHKSIQLEPGIWEIGQVNEYDYFSKMVRKVQD